MSGGRRTVRRAWHTDVGVTTALQPSVNLLATIGDPDGTRTVTSIIALLIALGLALAMVAVWLHRTTRPDPELLAPLEAMGERRWRRADPVAQRRTLDQLRPVGASPLEPSSAPPQLDAAFDAGPSAAGFDDLQRTGDDDLRGSTPTAAPSAEPVASLAPPVDDVTPRHFERPDAEQFTGDLDPDLIAAAAAELDAELRRRASGDE